jgi:hypothetical protein
MKPFAAPTSLTFTSSRHARHHWEAGPVDELLMVFLHGLQALALGPATTPQPISLTQSGLACM